MKILLAAAASVLLISAAPAVADTVTCSELLTQVNDTLAERSADLTQETLNEIIKLRDEGKASCEAGNEDEADEYLEEAISKFSQ